MSHRVYGGFPEGSEDRDVSLMYPSVESEQLCQGPSIAESGESVDERDGILNHGLFGDPGGIAFALRSVASSPWNLGAKHMPVSKMFSLPGQKNVETFSQPSFYEDEHEEGAEDAVEEDTQVVAPVYESKYIVVFPLYQEYCLQSLKAELCRVNQGSLPDLVTTQCLPGLHSPFTPHRSPVVTSPPPSPPPSPSPQPLRVSPCTLWQDLAEVKERGLVHTLTNRQIRLQESMFEMIASEASYLKSLGVAVNHFLASKTLRRTMSRMEHHVLFSNLRLVRAASEAFLLDLEVRLGESVVISQVGDVVLHHCPVSRSLYVPYVTNMMYQEATVNQLLRKNKEFLLAVKKLESDPVCQRQTLKSFLVLPFQRVTRLRIILESILKLTEHDSDSIPCLKEAIAAVHKIVTECDEGVRKMKQIEALVFLEKLVDFGNVKSIPLIISGRYLVHEGPLRQITVMGHPGLGSKISFMDIYLHLFNDLLLISMKRGQCFSVLYHAVFPINVHTEHLNMEVLDLHPESFLLRLSQNQCGHVSALMLTTHTRSDKGAWVRTLSLQNAGGDTDHVTWR